MTNISQETPHSIFSSYTKIMLVCFIILICVLPFLYNSLIYTFNYFLNISNIANIGLMISKDIILMGLCIILISMKRIWYGIILAILLVASVVLYSKSIFKFIFEPLLISLTILLYFNKLQSLLQKRLFSITSILVTFTILFILFGYFDMVYRAIHHINQENFFLHHYLYVNSKYRCAKELNFFSHMSKKEFFNCYTTPLNFYKLEYMNNKYSYITSLFMPIGDSIIFSFILICSTVLLMSHASYFSYKQQKTKTLSLIALIIMSISVYFTNIRTTSLVMIIFAFIFTCYLWHNKERLNSLIFILANLAAFLIKTPYLIFTIFSTHSPSNRGHFSYISHKITTSSAPKIGQLTTKSSISGSHLGSTYFLAAIFIIFTIYLVLKKINKQDIFKTALSGYTIFFLIYLMSKIYLIFLHYNLSVMVYIYLANIIFSCYCLITAYIFSNFSRNGFIRLLTIYFITLTLFLFYVFSIKGSLMLHANYGFYSPVESNLLRVYIGYGIFGLGIYTLVISILLYGLTYYIKNVRKFYLTHSIPSVLICSFIIINIFFILSYQMLSPYIISGYSSFALFLGTTLLLETYLRLQER